MVGKCPECPIDPLNIEVTCNCGLRGDGALFLALGRAHFEGAPASLILGSILRRPAKYRGCEPIQPSIIYRALGALSGVSREVGIE